MAGWSSGLWRSRAFVLYWAGQTVSQLGSGIGGTALPLTALLVLQATPVQMGLLTAMGAVPVLVLGLPAGVWVDRVRRRRILIAADLGRALLLASVPLAAALGSLRLGQLYLVAALVSLCTICFTIADESFLPSLVSREDLVKANSALGASDSLAEIGGSALGGVLVQAISAPRAVLIDALSFLSSAICLARMRVTEPAPPAVCRHVWHELREGLRLVLGDPLLRALAGSSGTFYFFGSFFGALYGLYAVRVLGFSPALLGLTIAVGGIGALVGALWAPRLVRRAGLGPVLSGSLLLAGAIQLPVPLATGPFVCVVALLMAAQFCGDVAIAVYLINEVSLRQALVTDRLRGRANACMQYLTTGVAPLGALLAGALGETLGVRQTLLIAVLGIMGASSWLFTSPLRRLRAQPAQLESQ
jgi:MFS family permease